MIDFLNFIIKKIGTGRIKYYLNNTAYKHRNLSNRISNAFRNSIRKFSKISIFTNFEAS